MGLFNILFGHNKKAEYLKELYAKGALIIDVRNPEEYVSGHIKDSTNIPLPRIGKSITSLKQKNKPIIAVCQSGGRSGMAVSILKTNGIDAYNGGPWNVLKNEIHIQ
jgi:phage shock protein E